MKPKFSIIMPTYKRNPIMMQRAIESVVMQSFNNWELIIVDDNGNESNWSKENKKFLERYKEDYRIKYIQHKENMGANAARNTGIKKSKGDLIAFLDSDDKWNTEKLKVTYNSYLENKECGVFYSSFHVIEKDKEYLDNKNKIEGMIFYKEILKDYISPTSAVVLKKECLEKNCGFDEKLPARQDYDMWLRVSKYYKFKYIDKPLVYIYRDGHESISSNYMNHVKGTEMVLDKILSNLSEEELKEYKEEIEINQYNYLALVCSRYKNYKLAKKYCYKSLKIKSNMRSILIYSLSTFPKAFEFSRKIRQKISFN